MKTNYTSHKRREKRLQVKLNAIEAKHPDFNFRNGALRSDLQKHWKIQKELINASVDAKACKDNNPDFMCSNCNCWKHSRAMCS